MVDIVNISARSDYNIKPSAVFVRFAVKDFNHAATNMDKIQYNLKVRNL